MRLHIPIISATGRLRQEDCCECKASLAYKSSSQPKMHSEILVQKDKKINKNKANKFLKNKLLLADNLAMGQVL